MHQAHFPTLNFPPSGQGKPADIVAVYDVRLFSIQNLADPPSRHVIPYFSNVPREANKRAGLLLAAEGPVKVIDWEAVNAHPIPILDDFARSWVQSDNHHDMAAMHHGFRQFSGRFFGAADNMGRIK
jgi:hypothetical protein